MEKKKRASVRNSIAGFFGLLIFAGLQYRMSGTAKPGSYTHVFDTALIAIGTVGALTAMLWPKREGPDG